jgi:hypothetical protein
MSTRRCEANGESWRETSEAAIVMAFCTGRQIQQITGPKSGLLSDARQSPAGVGATARKIRLNEEEANDGNCLYIH